MGIIPGGRGNDLARVLGIPSEPGGAVAVLAEGERARDRRRRGQRPPLPLHRLAAASTPRPTASPTRLGFVKGNLVYAYAALPDAGRLEARARSRSSLDGSEPISFGYSVAVANSRAFGGGMFVAPHAELDDGLLDVITVATSSKLRFLRGLPQVVQGHPPRERGGHRAARRRGRDQRRPRLRRLRRRRAPHRPAGDPQVLPRAQVIAPAGLHRDPPADARLTSAGDERPVRARSAASRAPSAT